MIPSTELDEEEIRYASMADRLVFAAAIIGFAVLIALY